MIQTNLSETKLLEAIHNLSSDYQQLVQDFVEFLHHKQKLNQTLQQNSVDISSTKEDDEKNYGYGSLAGQIIMSDDFDEPLEDLAEYM